MEKRSLIAQAVIPAVLVGLLCVLPAGARADDPVAAINLGASEVQWSPKVEYASILLTVSGPDGEVQRAEFKYPDKPSFRRPRDDGSYTYELTVTPRVDPGLRAAMRAAHQSGDDTFGRDLSYAGLMPHGAKQSGHFLVAGGQIVTDDAAEDTDDAEEMELGHE